MKRAAIVSIVAFAGGVAIGFFARGAMDGFPVRLNDENQEKIEKRYVAKMRRPSAADLDGIEKLHKDDVDATLTQDPAALNLLWAEDSVKLDVPGGPVAGLKALEAMYAKFRVDYPEFHVVKYEPNIGGVRTVDGWALETGTFAATFQMTAKDEPVSVSDKGARVLKRQPDGSWKFAVVGLK